MEEVKETVKGTVGSEPGECTEGAVLEVEEEERGENSVESNTQAISLDNCNSRGNLQSDIIDKEMGNLQSKGKDSAKQSYRENITDNSREGSQQESDPNIDAELRVEDVNDNTQSTGKVSWKSTEIPVRI